MSREFVCKDCHHIGIPNGYKSMKGNIVVSTLLWTFLFPGLLYSIWRRSGPAGRCEKCYGKRFARLRSKLGKAAMEEVYMKEFAKGSSKE